MATPKNFFSKEELSQIVETIKRVEQNTSAEIRVHISNNIKKDVIADAWNTFDKIGMSKTKHRNGVLIYFTIEDKQISIIGDEGINKIVEENYWNSLLYELILFFKKEQFLDGIIRTIDEIGEKLKCEFPPLTNQNELSDEVSFD